MGEGRNRRMRALEAEAAALRGSLARLMDANHDRAREADALRADLAEARDEAALRRFQRNCWICAAVGLLAIQLAAALMHLAAAVGVSS